MIKRKEFTEQSQSNFKYQKLWDERKQQLENSLSMLMLSQPQIVNRLENSAESEWIQILSEYLESLRTCTKFIDLLKLESTKRQTYYLFGDQQSSNSLLHEIEQAIPRCIQQAIRDVRRRERYELLQMTLQNILQNLEAVFPVSFDNLMQFDFRNLQDQTLETLGIDSNLVSTIQHIFLQIIYSSPHHLQPEITSNPSTAFCSSEEIKDIENELQLFIELVRGRATEACFAHAFLVLQQSIQSIEQIFPTLIQDCRVTPVR